MSETMQTGREFADVEHLLYDAPPLATVDGELNPVSYWIQRDRATGRTVDAKWCVHLDRYAEDRAELLARSQAAGEPLDVAGHKAALSELCRTVEAAAEML